MKIALFSPPVLDPFAVHRASVLVLAQGDELCMSKMILRGPLDEFELSNRPSVLIFSTEDNANAQRNQHIGAFLTGLIQNDPISESETRAALVAACSVAEIHQGDVRDLPKIQV